MDRLDLHTEHGRTRFAVDMTRDAITMRSVSREPGFPARPLRNAFAALALVAPLAMSWVVGGANQYVAAAMTAGGAILVAFMCGWFDTVERRAFEKPPYFQIRSAVVARGEGAYRSGGPSEVSIHGRDEGPPKGVILGVCVMTVNRANGIQTSLTTFQVMLAFRESVAVLTSFSERYAAEALRCVTALREAVGLDVSETYVAAYPRVSNTPGAYLGMVVATIGELGVYALSCFLSSPKDGGGAWRVDIAVAAWIAAHVVFQAILLRLVRRDAAWVAARLIALEGASPISETDFGKA